MSIVFPRIEPTLQQNALDYYRGLRKVLGEQTPSVVQGNCPYCGNGGHDPQSHTQPPANGMLNTGLPQDAWYPMYQPTAAQSPHY
jgi:hypothetical protein